MQSVSKRVELIPYAKIGNKVLNKLYVSISPLTMKNIKTTPSVFQIAPNILYEVHHKAFISKVGLSRFPAAFLVEVVFEVFR